ncbi:MAG: hypothetical protein RL324_1459 [Verrucomicrobiota bacterium]|jgi:hypothetical protein
MAGVRRKIRWFWWPALLLAGTLLAEVAPPFFHRGRIVPLEGGGWADEDALRTARETVSHATDTPMWTNPTGFGKDVFTFARIKFYSETTTMIYQGHGGSLSWWVDYPDADLNLSYRLQQLTTIRTDPDGRVLFLTDPDLTDFPFIYMSHPENMVLDPDEIMALRRYLDNGGFLVMIDLWNNEGWRKFAAQMAQVLPGRAWTELDTTHPLFRMVYNLEGPMENLRMPTLQFWNKKHLDGDRSTPLQTVNRGPGSDEMHVRALHDDKGRMMVLAVHNSDISDGWEREGENQQYFEKFSEKRAYPFGINLMIYLLTH